MSTYELVSLTLHKFLLDLAGTEEDFVYEVTFKKDQMVNTIRSKSVMHIMQKIQQFNHCRDAYISPFNTRYPEKSSDFVHGRQMISSNVVVIDLDSKSGVPVDYKTVLQKLKEAGIAKPSYLVSTGSGCHLWYFLSHHVGRSTIINIYDHIKRKIESVDWPHQWKVDNLSPKQQIRIPLTINHKYDKVAVVVGKGEKVAVQPYNFTKPHRYTKKELKECRRERKGLGRVSKKPSPTPLETTEITKNIKDNMKNRFIAGANNLKIHIRENIFVCEEKLKIIIKLLNYGKSYLSCRVAGEALGISYKAAAKFLKKCVLLGYLEKYQDDNSAYCYNVKVSYEVEKAKTNGPKRSRCPISGPGESNKAICKLAFQAFINCLDPHKTIERWILDYYHLTSREHDPTELIGTFSKVYQKFKNKIYEPYISPT